MSRFRFELCVEETSSYFLIRLQETHRSAILHPKMPVVDKTALGQAADHRVQDRVAGLEDA